MPSSCKDIRQALAQCLQESDCIMVQRNSPRDCLNPPHLEQLPIQCQQLRKGLGECKRGLVDMRKRFRGNQPVSISKEKDVSTGEVIEKRTPVPQLYAGKPVVQSVKETSGNEGVMDPEKTRGL
ncbi:hypothetical protein LOZ12_005264 [Ophidiomyces ophidiicola]|uniref:Uncharacterized protein n=1 Tax=Ophidiomyces ophidiicola TaxID=1387563 RepID=A0ACB8UPV5_9EURO|nr:uncharacterized protein LOZ57_006775 [Ophidiomyces ophidiicola]KAI1936390.1 hypothetical protein LOZ57_006775 [Ophidiomyces ophidiicola]KAI1949649.1 hypothetical protein LOZ62_002201 [Ophidiomyces ophidiicola]KAI1967992.1 hypothetical protein LOZ56_005270 [Ophidiomyces ophidiicola]KAI2009672.1 hypothetical protein LOZ50_001406 [Ophidiomyces ophidiicola]KAI2023044.1 hypothetical protein LOZ45_004127 [Ophidiomyces ophidiicola]